MRPWPRSHRFFGFTGSALAVVLAIGTSLASPLLAPDDDLEFLTAILRNDAVPSSVRTNAAVRLLRLGGEVSDEVLAESLRSGDPLQVEAVARALAENGEPRMFVAEALVEALETATPEIGVLAGRSLACLGDDQVAPLVLVASNPELSSDARVSAIRALGAFQSRVAVNALIELLPEARSPVELTAVTGGLRQITRIDLGEDPQRWRAWWDAVGDMPLEQAIGAASANRERQLEQQRERIDFLEAERAIIGSRLQTVLGAWFVTLPEDEREPRVREMLEDDMVFVRQFAGMQVQRMLRNGVSPEQQTIDAVMRLLDDEESSIRGLGAQLLSAMRVEGLANRLAKEVAEETDSQVAALMLEQIALRPSAAAFAPTLARLNDQVTASSAAKALSRLVAEGMVPEDWAEQARGSVRVLHAQSRTPAIAALLVLAGEPHDLEQALADLDHDSIAVRRASAFAFVTRGMYEEVARRGADEGVRPAAIQALVLLGPTRENFQNLLLIQPAESELPAWRKAVEDMAFRFPLSERLEIDDLLASDVRISTSMRVTLLSTALTAGPNELGDESRLPMLRRHTYLLETDNRWQEVAEVLVRSDFARDEELKLRLFTARMRLGDFEGAAVVEDSPQVWLDFLDGTIEVAPAEAVSIASEIQIRFDGTLSAEQRDYLESIARKLTIVNGTEDIPDGR